MTTNTREQFRQYLGMGHGEGYVIRLRTRKGQRYANAQIIASFQTYDEMHQAWDQVTTAEGMTDVYGSQFD